MKNWRRRQSKKGAFRS